MSKPRLLTILGTRPEIIRLSRIIPKLDAEFEHVLVHTGQNFDPKLSDIFFKELEIREPDYFLNINHLSLAKAIAEVLIRTEELIGTLKPQGLFVLGDTNSAMAAIIAKRMQIPVYHWEAGNRSFDENVPEETNRKIIDHVAHYNIAYSRHAAQNLLKEGIAPDKVVVSGSPMKEVLDYYREKITSSDILRRLNVVEKKYLIASIHRQENVDSEPRLREIISSLAGVQKKYKLPVLVSTHPRTRLRIQDMSEIPGHDGVTFLEPFGYFDYITLQMNAFCVISDSGTVSEESGILDFPAVTIRDSMERPEALEAKTISMTGLSLEGVLEGIEWAVKSRSHDIPEAYNVATASEEVVKLIKNTIMSFEAWSGVRPLGSGK